MKRKFKLKILGTTYSYATVEVEAEYGIDAVPIALKNVKEGKVKLKKGATRYEVEDIKQVKIKK